MKRIIFGAILFASLFLVETNKSNAFFFRRNIVIVNNNLGAVGAVGFGGFGVNNLAVGGFGGSFGARIGFGGGFRGGFARGGLRGGARINGGFRRIR